MKKLKVLTIAFAAVMLSLVSLNVKGQDFKPAGGENNFQVMFAPLGGSPISIGGIAYRKFNSDASAAWRVNVFIGMTHKTSVIGQPIDTGSFSTGGGVPEADSKSSTFTLGIRPGYEFHWAGTEHLAPYWGVEANFSMTSASVDSDFVATNGSTSQAATAYQVLTGTTKGKGANTTIGLNVITGFDYYFAKSFSIGVEIGFGFSMTSMPDITNTTLGYNKTTSAAELVTSPTQKQGSSFQLGPNAMGSFKLGWLF